MHYDTERCWLTSTASCWASVPALSSCLLLLIWRERQGMRFTVHDNT